MSRLAESRDILIDGPVPDLRFLPRHADPPLFATWPRQDTIGDAASPTTTSLRATRLKSGRVHLPPPHPLIDELQARYPSLAGLPIDWGALDVARDIPFLEVVPGTRLFEAGMQCAGFPLVLEGEIQVSRSSPGGRSLELYRVVVGEVCIVSTASLLSHRPLSAQGTAVARTRLALLPSPLFEQWTDYPPFRQFVFGVFADRLGDLMAVVDALAFHRLDQRLADYLLGHGRVIHITHQALADELGTVREIVTRLLNRFESMGAIELGRERIEVKDAIALRALAAGTAASPG